MKTISIVVPCYNEEEMMPIYYQEVIKHLSEDINYNIIFVDDGSKDKTRQIARELSEKDTRIKYVSFSKNFGKEAAMYAGLEAAKKLNSDAAIVMDVDLQDPPRLIPELNKYHEEGYNLIYTKQKNRNGAGLLSKFFSLSFYKVYAFLTKDKGMAKGARDFALLDRKAIDAFLQIKDVNRFTKGIYHYVGFKTKCIEFDYEKRAAGETKWNFRKLFRYAMKGIKEFSSVYLYIPTLFIFLVSLFLCHDIGSNIVHCVKANDITAWSWDHIWINSIALFVLITLKYLFKLLYEVRNTVQNRPIYIEEESNINAN